MLLNPAIIALNSGSLLVTAFAFYALYTALRILTHWNIQSGSELQLLLEKKTYLISTVFSYVLGFELFSLVLFIFTAEHMHDLFVGAMCAAGSLNANDYGYVALVVKIITFMICGVWMIVNHTDNQAHDYPLIRPKYKLLILLTVMIALDTILQIKYFMGLRTDVITSCCGIIFSGESQSLTGSAASLPTTATMLVFYAALLLTLRVGFSVVITGRGAALYGLLAGATTIISLAAVISFISVYYYQLPTHHCPFCILQKDYSYIGYPLYLSLLLAGTTGMGTGVVESLKGPKSLAKVIPILRKRFCLISLAGFLIFALIASYPILFTDFVLNS
ncbi:MAG: hypothetical protein KKD01_10860 [Proteobacteria bacterium]|nr:hypothetical protein [Pseudomonadota bacterium]MBU1420179.1 hypothetical protein [Pseudomonadota bacterium]MBU1455215.1 hypothetical protein [Pseudomonadota bacterium]